MAKVEIKLDHGGIADVLKSEARTIVDAMAERIANTERASLPEGTDVHVDHYTTDRAAASVTIRDAMGKLYVVRDGALIRSAAANGAEVKARR